MKDTQLIMPIKYFSDDKPEKEDRAVVAYFVVTDQDRITFQKWKKLVDRAREIDISFESIKVQGAEGVHWLLLEADETFELDELEDRITLTPTDQSVVEVAHEPVDLDAYMETVDERMYLAPFGVYWYARFMSGNEGFVETAVVPWEKLT